MKILLLLNDTELSSILTFSLESKYAAEVVQVPSVDEGIELLKSGEPLDIVLCDYPGSSDRVVSTLLAADLKIPCLIYKKGKGHKISTFNGTGLTETADKDSLVENLFQAVNQIIEKSEIETDLEHTEFGRIKTPLLLRVSPLQADIYIRLSESKYLKLFQKGDSFAKEDFEKYVLKKKIDYLYLKRGDAPVLLNRLTETLAFITDNAETIPVEAREQVVVQTHEVFTDLIQRLGVTEEVQKLVKANTELAIKTMVSNRELSQIFAKLQKDKSKYISAHSMMLAHLACALAAKLHWNSSITFHKLTLAAFMHDTTLNNHELAAISSLKELQAKKDRFTPEEVRSYPNHPLDAAELVRKFNEIPADVDTIVAQHHELPDASGFPRKIGNTYISPLSAILIVAHEIIDLIYKTGSDKIPKDAMDVLSKKYNVGNFKKVMALVREDLS